MYKKNAVVLFTRPLFFIVRDEIVNEKFMVMDKRFVLEDKDFFVVRKFLHEGRQWSVKFRRSDKFLQCSCMKFKSKGILCSHVFVVLKANHVSVILDSLVNLGGQRL